MPHTCGRLTSPLKKRFVFKKVRWCASHTVHSKLVTSLSHADIGQFANLSRMHLYRQVLQYIGESALVRVRLLTVYSNERDTKKLTSCMFLADKEKKTRSYGMSQMDWTSPVTELFQKPSFGVPLVMTDAEESRRLHHCGDKRREEETDDVDGIDLHDLLRFCAQACGGEWDDRLRWHLEHSGTVSNSFYDLP